MKNLFLWTKRVFSIVEVIIATSILLLSFVFVVAIIVAPNGDVFQTLMICGLLLTSPALVGSIFSNVGFLRKWADKHAN